MELWTKKTNFHYPLICFHVHSKYLVYFMSFGDVSGYKVHISLFPITCSSTKKTHSAPFHLLFEQRQRDSVEWTNPPLFIEQNHVIRIDALHSMYWDFYRVILAFIWDRKTHCRKDLFQRSGSQDGMNLPHFKLYYWA